MLEIAEESNAVDGAAWLRKAISTYDNAGDDEKQALAQFGCARHQLLQKLAETLVDAGQRTAASEAFQEASEAAMEAGKAKISMKLAAKAEEYAEEEEDEVE